MTLFYYAVLSGLVVTVSCAAIIALSIFQPFSPSTIFKELLRTVLIRFWPLWCFLLAPVNICLFFVALFRMRAFPAHQKESTQYRRVKRALILAAISSLLGTLAVMYIIGRFFLRVT